jgi:hypothetical protein
MACFQHLLVACALLASPAQPHGTPVDLELVLASDVSLSVDAEERDLQREGFARAVQDPLVVAAIAAGPLGRIAVTYVEWSGQRDHEVVVPWTLIDSNDTAIRFARAVKEARTPIKPGATAIGNALRFSATLFGKNGFAGMRRVIDISGDGSSNDGIPVAKARDDIIREGITINGLPIHPSERELEGKEGAPEDRVEDHYRVSVIGGQGAFLFAVHSMRDFEPMLRRKLVLEIAFREDSMGQHARFAPVIARPAVATNSR